MINVGCGDNFSLLILFLCIIGVLFPRAGEVIALSIGTLITLKECHGDLGSLGFVDFSKSSGTGFSLRKVLVSG